MQYIWFPFLDDNRRLPHLIDKKTNLLTELGEINGWQGY